MDTSWVPAGSLFDLTAQKLSQRRFGYQKPLADPNVLDRLPLKRLVNSVAPYGEKRNEIARSEDVRQCSKARRASHFQLRRHSVVLGESVTSVRINCWHQ